MSTDWAIFSAWGKSAAPLGPGVAADVPILLEVGKERVEGGAGMLDELKR